jgi:trehalose 6-phosphate synthase
MDHPDPVILVSHRGPLQHRREDGRRVAERGAGGLVTALSHLADHLEEATWVCAALSEEDEAVAAESPDGFPLDGDRPGVRVRMVAVDAEAERKFYGVIANPLLWFIQHSLWDLATTPDITAEYGRRVAITEWKAPMGASTRTRRLRRSRAIRSPPSP